MRAVIIRLLLPVIAGAQGPRYGCEPAPDVSAAFARVEALRFRAASDEFRTKSRDILRAAVRGHPGDVFANLRYLSLYYEKGHDDIVASYRSAMQAHEGDRRHALYYAASLIGKDTPEALRRLTALAAPDFPYPYLLIGQIRSYPKFKDNAALSTNLIQFVEACPSYLPGYELLAYMGTGDELKAVARQLRDALKGRSDRDAVAAYGWLWSIEFRVTQPADHDSLRHRIKQEMTTLGISGALDDPAALATARVGYRISGNTEALNALPPPDLGREPIYDIAEQWHKEHRFPAQNAPEEQKQAYYRATAQAAQMWIGKWSDEPMPYARRFWALSQLTDTTEAELITAGEELIAVNRRRPGKFLRVPAIIDVARAYVDRGIRLDAVPGMIETGLREAEATQRYPESDLFDDRNHRMNEEFRYESRIQARSVQFEWSLKTSSLATAHEALALIRKDLDGMLRITTGTRTPQLLDSGYWDRMARLADLEGRAQDAVEYRRAANNAKNAPVRVEDLPESARVVGKPLPPFRVAGIDGRAWTNVDLDGKVAVLSVWATWCGPCIEELSHLQKLYDTLKDRPDVVLLSLNVDSNPGVVRPFLQGRGLTFPVVLAHKYVNQILPEFSIPRNWIVESGIVRSEDVGFADPEAWIKRMLTRVEDALGQR